MILNPLIPWLLVAGAAAVPAQEKRATELTLESVTLYAYGKSIAGRPILADSNGARELIRQTQGQNSNFVRIRIRLQRCCATGQPLFGVM